MAAVDTTASAVGTSAASGETPIGTIAQSLPMLSQTSAGEVHTIGQISQVLSRSAYITSGKEIEGEWSLYESYDKNPIWDSPTNGPEFTMALTMRWDGDPNQSYPMIWTNGNLYIGGEEWYDGGAKRFYIYLYDNGYNGWEVDTVGISAHDIDYDEWFTLFISIDYSAATTPTVHAYIQKIGESTATDLVGTVGDNDVGPIDLGFDNTSISSFASHQWYGSQSSNISICEVAATNEYVDWSDSAERAKYIDTSGHLVGLGTGGINLTGTTLKIYAPDGDMSNNQGSGGDYTEVGTITDSSTSPTDGLAAGPWFNQSATGLSNIALAIGEAAQTLNSISQSGIGVAGDHVGAVAQTLPLISQASAGTFVRGFAGAISQPLPLITQTGSAISWEGIDTGAITQALSFLNLSMTAVYWPGHRWASAAQTLWPIRQLAAAGSSLGTNTADILQTLNSINQSLSGRNPGIYPGRIAQTLPFVTQVVTATYGPGIKIGIIDSTLSMLIQTGFAYHELSPSSGYVNLFLRPITQSLTGALAHAGVIGQTTPSVAQYATATYDSGTYTAAGAQLVPFVAQTLAGKMARTGTTAQLLAPLFQNLSGTYGPGEQTGGIQQVIPLILQACTATYGPGIQTGTITQVLPFIEQDMVAALYIIGPPTPLTGILWEQEYAELVWEQEPDELIWEQ